METLTRTGLVWVCSGCGREDHADALGICRYCGSRGELEEREVDAVEEARAVVVPEPPPARWDSAPPAREEFSLLLRSFRERAQRSRYALGKEVGVDPSYLNRLESGLREPPRQHIVEALARKLRLSVVERDRLLVAAGYAPLSVVQLGAWDECLSAVVGVLSNADLSPAERAEYRSVVQAISGRYQRRV